MAVEVKSLDHIHIYATDPDSSAQFYEEYFGATPISRDANINGDLRIFLALGGQVVVVGSFPNGLAAAEPPAPGDGAYTHGFGVAHFGLRVADVDAAVTDLVAGGVRILSPTVREPSGLTYAYVAAPDGVVIELTQYEQKRGLTRSPAQVDAAVGEGEEVDFVPVGREGVSPKLLTLAVAGEHGP